MPCILKVIFMELSKKNIINISNTKFLRIVSDFYHIIKRLRYRLLSSKIHAGFTINSISIDIDQLKKIW